MRTLWQRMRGAAVLDADTYEEVEADKSSLFPAACIVVMAALLAGGARLFQGYEIGLEGERLLLQALISTVEPIVLWIGGSAFAFMLGATFFRGPETETDFAEVLRTSGFAFTPALLRVGLCIPPPALGLTIDLAARVWTFIAVVVALRQAFDFTTPRAVGTLGTAAILLWLVLWGASVVPLPF